MGGAEGVGDCGAGAATEDGVSFSPLAVLNASKAAAWKYTPAKLAHWREDIAQDVAVFVTRHRQKSDLVGQQSYNWAAQHAVRRLAFLLRYQVELPEGWTEGDDAEDMPLPVASRPELGPIALWRLQQCWDELSDIQRLAMTTVLTGDSPTEAGRPYGLCARDLARGAKAVCARLNGRPMTRKGRRAKLASKAPTPEKDAARKLKDRDRERRRRAEKREAA